MKKVLLTLAFVLGAITLAPFGAKAGVFIGFPLPVPVPVFYGPAYRPYPPGYYYGPRGYVYYRRPYWRHRYWARGHWCYY
ncbi:MAG: hypothetical protein JO069_04940 [Verrucomicrobia bacterium]|nr:hypothetical protein [Verrucomicrobiota bacterium]